jgi:hypothetical protein
VQIQLFFVGNNFHIFTKKVKVDRGESSVKFQQNKDFNVKETANQGPGAAQISARSKPFSRKSAAHTKKMIERSARRGARKKS